MRLPIPSSLRHLSAGFVFVCLLLPGVAPVSAQEGSTIRSIRINFEGPVTVDEGRVRANLMSREGEPYSSALVEKDVVNLVESGDVENVDVDVGSAGGGVALTYRIRSKSLVGAISFEGGTRFDQDRLRDESELKVGQALTDALLTKTRANIVELYTKKGYPDIDVSYKIGTMEQSGYSAVTFVITEGGRSLVNSISFAGNTSMREKDIRKEIETKRKTFWRFGKSGKVDNETLDRDIKTVEHYYQDRGYFDAKVVGVDRQRVSDKAVDVVFQISEGPLYNIAAVEIQGIKAFPAADLAPFLLVTPGSLYSLKSIETDVKSLNDFYGSRGYADVNVFPRLLDAGPQNLKVVYVVNEGARSYIRQINISGNEVTKDKVIRRELAFAPGDEFNTVRVKASKDRIQNLGYFETVDVRVSGTEVPAFKDINVQVQEKLTGSFNIGAGFSSIDSFVAFISVAQTNFDLLDWPSFRGAGQKFRANIRYGDQRRDAEISFVEPWFLEQRLALGVDLFYRDLYYLSDYYDQRNIGGSVSLRFPAGENGFFRVQYRLQDIDVYNIDKKASPEIAAEEGTYLESRVSAEYVYDTRDSVFLPRNGRKFSLEAAVMGGLLAGDVDNYSINADYEQHWGLPLDTIITVRSNLGVVDGISNGDNVPIFNRLFLGGAQNLRGFDYRDVGPKDFRGEPIGGQTLAALTVEYTFPIIEKVRGAVFYDVGFVNADPFDFSTNDLNSNVGIGLRLYLTSFPINLDFGYPIQADDFNDSGGKFNFTIGFQY